MITKEQWDDFVGLVYLTKTEGFHPFMNGQRVYEVDLDNKEIVTIKRNEPRVRYKHPESLSSYTKLDRLYASVSFNNLNLLQIKKFPKPRLIKEGFMPERNIMKGYRIKKVTKGRMTRFIPQQQFLWIFWLDMFQWPKEVFPDDLGGFGSYEEALNELYRTLPYNEAEKKVKVEYLDVPYGNREPNPPPRNP